MRNEHMSSKSSHNQPQWKPKGFRLLGPEGRAKVREQRLSILADVARRKREKEHKAQLDGLREYLHMLEHTPMDHIAGAFFGPTIGRGLEVTKLKLGAFATMINVATTTAARWRDGKHLPEFDVRVNTINTLRQHADMLLNPPQPISAATAPSEVVAAALTDDPGQDGMPPA